MKVRGRRQAGSGFLVFAAAVQGEAEVPASRRRAAGVLRCLTLLLDVGARVL